MTAIDITIKPEDLENPDFCMWKRDYLAASKDGEGNGFGDCIECRGFGVIETRYTIGYCPKYLAQGEKD